MSIKYEKTALLDEDDEKSSPFIEIATSTLPTECGGEIQSTSVEDMYRPGDDSIPNLHFRN
jgi:hypothetical protein